MLELETRQHPSSSLEISVCIYVYGEHCLKANYFLMNALVIMFSSKLFHYNDYIMSTIASQITSLTIIFPPFIQAQMKENTKAPQAIM